MYPKLRANTTSGVSKIKKSEGKIKSELPHVDSPLQKFGRLAVKVPGQILRYMSSRSESKSSIGSICDEGEIGKSLSSVPSSTKDTSVIPYGFSFAPAGLLFPYHLGVARYLQHAGILTDDTPVMGASAGALVAACICLGLSDQAIFKVLYKLEADFMINGTRGRMRRPLKNALQETLSDDSHIILNKRAQPCVIVYGALSPFGIHGEFCTKFSSKDDLIQCLLASCNIPMYFTSKPWVNVRGHWGVDGYFSDVRTLGTPSFKNIVQVAKQVRIMPFEASKILSNAAPRDYIAPDLAYYDHSISRSAIDLFKNYVKSHPSPTPTEVGEQTFIKKKSLNNYKRSKTAVAESETTNAKNSNSPSILPEVAGHSSFGDALCTELNLKADDMERQDSLIEESVKNEFGSHTYIDSVPKIKHVFSDFVARVAGSQHERPTGSGINPWGMMLRSHSATHISEQTSLNAHQQSLSRDPQLPFCRFSWPRLLQLAMTPAEESSVVAELFELGRADAFRWHQLISKPKS